MPAYTKNDDGLLIPLPTKPNPFLVQDISKRLALVEKKLAEVEKKLAMREEKKSKT